MKYLYLLSLLSLFFGPLSYANLEMKPGLWQVNTEMEVNGKVINPVAELEENLKKLPPEKRQEMEKMIGQIGVEKNGGFKVCYSSESLKRPEALAKTDQMCTSKVTSHTTKKVMADIDCKDGTKGKSTWEVKDAQNYIGHIDMKGPQGATKMSYTGKFESSDCGHIKPLSP